MTYYNLDLEANVFNLIELVSDGMLYFGDPETDGSWRLIRNGTELDAERRESGIWVDKGGFTA